MGEQRAHFWVALAVAVAVAVAVPPGMIRGHQFLLRVIRVNAVAIAAENAPARNETVLDLTAATRIFADQQPDDRREMTAVTTRAGLELLHGKITREIIGAFFDVYNELGYGFFEAVYQRALPLALATRGIGCKREVPLVVRFRGAVVGEYRADLVVENSVIVESKVADKIVPVHEMQLLNYLKATGITVGLVLNFGPRATFRRLLLSSPSEGSAVIRSSSA